MGGRTTTYESTHPWQANRESLVRDSGINIDWDQVPESYRITKQTVKANGAAAAGATSITVDALPVKVQAGTMLNFGTYAPVTVTVNDASVLAGETTMTVAALSGPIPSGTVLQFSGAGAGFAKLTADAALGATTLTVEALPEGIDNAATATFAGGTIQARVTANAAAADTTLTVDELQFAIADDAEASLPGTGAKRIKSGTVMCRLSAGKGVPRADRPGSETASGFLETDAVEDDRSSALSGYGHIIGGVLYENFLPEATGSPAVISSTYKTELQTAGVGTGFGFLQYADTRS